MWGDNNVVRWKNENENENSSIDYRLRTINFWPQQMDLLVDCLAILLVFSSLSSELASCGCVHIS